MIRTAERAVAILSRRDLLGQSRDKESGRSSGIQKEEPLHLNLDNQRYIQLHRQGLASEPDLKMTLSKD